MAGPRLLAFGFLLPFASAFGQTFFIGLFGDHLRAAYGLTNASFGLLYSLATVTSAGLLMWLGRLIDRVDLRHYTAAVATASVSPASPSCTIGCRAWALLFRKLRCLFVNVMSTSE